MLPKSLRQPVGTLVAMSGATRPQQIGTTSSGELLRPPLISVGRNLRGPENPDLRFYIDDHLRRGPCGSAATCALSRQPHLTRFPGRERATRLHLAADRCFCLTGDHDRRLYTLGAHDHVRYARDVAPPTKQRRRPGTEHVRPGPPNHGHTTPIRAPSRGAPVRQRSRSGAGVLLFVQAAAGQRGRYLGGVGDPQLAAGTLVEGGVPEPDHAGTTGPRP